MPRMKTPACDLLGNSLDISAARPMITHAKGINFRAASIPSGIRALIKKVMVPSIMTQAEIIINASEKALAIAFLRAIETSVSMTGEPAGISPSFNVRKRMSSDLPTRAAGILNKMDKPDAAIWSIDEPAITATGTATAVQKLSSLER
jgi:hypothetical protein